MSIGDEVRKIETAVVDEVKRDLPLVERKTDELLQELVDKHSGAGGALDLIIEILLRGFGDHIARPATAADRAAYAENMARAATPPDAAST